MDEYKSEYPGGWKLTDDSCMQYVRRVGHRAFELVQYESYFYDEPRIEVYADTICLDDYKNDEIAEILRSYDYKDVEDVRQQYGSCDAANQIIAECVFEHYLCMANEPIAVVTTEEEAIAAVMRYLEANHELPPDHWKIEVSLEELALMMAGLETGEEMSFVAVENDLEENFGVVRLNYFDDDIIHINSYGGGKPIAISVGWDEPPDIIASILLYLRGCGDYLGTETVYVDSTPGTSAPQQYKRIDPEKLPRMADVICAIEENGHCDRGAAELREQYEKTIGFDPIWRQHVGDDWHNGAIIMPVREGILYIPYDDVYASDGDWEIFITEKASLLDADSTDHLLKLTEDYMSEYMVLLRSLSGMLRKQSKWPTIEAGGDKND